MSMSVEEIAKDIVVAWLSNTQVSLNINDPEKTGESIGTLYTTVAKAVHEEKSRRTAGNIHQFK
jgi:hypothetical protein